MRRLVLSPLVFIVVFLFAGCSNEATQQHLKGQTMGTTWSVKYLGKPSINAQVIQDYLDQFNQIASTYIENSEISLLNHQPIKQWIPLSEELAKLIQLSLRMSEQTEGAFDITVGKAVNYWGFGAQKETSQPSKQEIGYQYLRLEDNRLYKEKNVFLDLSAIAKGYAVDQIAQLLDEAKINHYLVEIGGEIKAKGKNSKQQFWTIAIEEPNPLQRSIMQTLTLKNQAIASSGSYRNFIQKKGEIISHTIDPKTAQPIQHTIIASSVITDSAAKADAFATAFMVLPVKRSLKISHQYQLATLIVTGELGDNSSFQKHYSNHFKQESNTAKVKDTLGY